MIHILVDIDETILSVPAGINAKASAVMFNRVFAIDAHEEMIDNVGKTELGIIKEVLEKVGVKKRTAEQESSSIEIPSEAYRVWADATSEELRIHTPRILPGIPELLTTLSKNPNVKLELLSGSSTERAEAKLKSVNLDGFFRDSETNRLRGVFGEIGPKRTQLFDAIKSKTTDEDKFVIIDDSIIGAKMAQEYNIPIIMVATGAANVEQLRFFTPHTFTDFGDGRWQEVVILIGTIA